MSMVILAMSRKLLENGSKGSDIMLYKISYDGAGTKYAPG